MDLPPCFFFFFFLVYTPIPHPTMESKKRDVPVNISTFTRHYFTSKANEKLSIAEVRNLHDTSHRSFLWGSMGIGAMILLRARRMMSMYTLYRIHILELIT